MVDFRCIIPPSLLITHNTRCNTHIQCMHTKIQPPRSRFYEKSYWHMFQVALRGLDGFSFLALEFVSAALDAGLNACFASHALVKSLDGWSFATLTHCIGTTLHTQLCSLVHTLPSPLSYQSSRRSTQDTHFRMQPNTGIIWVPILSQ